MAITAIAHPNIALIKYWGKQTLPGNVPATPSVSITLDSLTSTTTVRASETDEIILNGLAADDAKINACLDMLRSEFSIEPVTIESENNFPTAAGLASSASGFAALITALDAFSNLGLSIEARSVYARKASGSAARSIYGGFASLSGPDWVGKPVLDRDEWPLKVVIAVTDESRKSVSSSQGMKTSEQTSPYYDAWVSSTARGLRGGPAGHRRPRLRATGGSVGVQLPEDARRDAVQFAGHDLLARRPPFPASTRFAELRSDGTPVFFTIDAGPQVKAVCLPEAESRRWPARSPPFPA